MWFSCLKNAQIKQFTIIVIVIIVTVIFNEV